MSNTAFSEAFEKIGILPRDAEFNIAIAKYLNSGGDFVGAQALLDAAKQMTVAGRPSSASLRGHSNGAGDSQPLEGDEAIRSVSQDLRKFASSPSINLDRTGQREDASSRCHAFIARPDREQKPQRSPIDFGATSVAIKTKLAEAVFERRTSDGRAWGNVGAHELDGMSRDGALAKVLKDKIGVLSNSQRFMKVRELISPEKFEQAMVEAHGA